MKKFMSQETLKIIACLTMLIDHIAAVFLPWEQALPLRIVGRIAFPIFCFLLAEGAHYTRNPLKYGLRLLIGVILAELPFDLLFFGKLTWEHSSVMVTLFLGLLAIVSMQKLPQWWLKVPAIVVSTIVAEALGTDYGGLGVLLMLGMYLARDAKFPAITRAVVLLVVSWAFGSYPASVASDLAIPIQMFSLLALIPIELYSGKKLIANPVMKWGFYLFYPVHITAFLLITQL